MSAIDASSEPILRENPKTALWNDPKIRNIAWQSVLLIAIGFLLYQGVSNAAENLARAKIASGFGFWNNTAGFAINQRLIEYSEASTYGRAFWVGLINTLLVASIGCVLATFLGFTIGVARLSPNWIVNRLAMVYVEIVRNTPLLLQLFFWYNAVLKPLPNPRDSFALGGGILVNNRGLFLPDPVFGSGSWMVVGLFLVGIAGTLLFRSWAHKKQAQTGEQYPVAKIAVAAILGLPALAWLVLSFTIGNPITFIFPTLRGFNLVGGIQIFPEFAALLLGLVIYTAAFIGEIVRAGIQAVSRGQSEASYALGLRPSPTLNLVVIPQAMRVIIPPLTSQYLNLTKNSSLAVAIGYPDLVQVFAGTVLNQTGQAVEVIMITMAVYLTISLLTSFVMNIYNKRKALVER